MPLFAGKFTPRKSNLRKISSTSTLYREFDGNQLKSELGLDYGEVSLNLDGIIYIFDRKEAQWKCQMETVKLEKNDEESKEIDHLIKRNQEIIEENRLLKIKIEIMLDMVGNFVQIKCVNDFYFS